MQASDTRPEPEAYYQHHVFFCLNQRENGEGCCAQFQAQEAFNHCKKRIKDLGLAGPGKVRINKAGCLDRCSAGPVMVVYPQNVWYTYTDLSDVDEIIDRHLQQGDVVERLRTPAHLGR
jgi:(2Fe-2S) ferredoxin